MIRQVGMYVSTRTEKIELTPDQKPLHVCHLVVLRAGGWTHFAEFRERLHALGLRHRRAELA